MEETNALEKTPGNTLVKYTGNATHILNAVLVETDPYVWFERGKEWKEEENWTDAVFAFERAVFYRPEMQEVYPELAFCRQKLGREIEATDSSLLINENTVTDIDDNVYHTVRIGTQVWMVENLKTMHYRDGTPIPNVTDAEEWKNLKSGAYCDYNNDAKNSDTYGRLYNWYAATDSHNIAPIGFHVPSDAEWKILTDYLGGEKVAGDSLKEKGTTHWTNYNTGATNKSEFKALPGGNRIYDGSFLNMGRNGLWWSSSHFSSVDAFMRGMDLIDSGVYRYSDGTTKSRGFSVRCLRD